MTNPAVIVPLVCVAAIAVLLLVLIFVERDPLGECMVHGTTVQAGRDGSTFTCGGVADGK